jgi:hypothetical protein
MLTCFGLLTGIRAGQRERRKQSESPHVSILHLNEWRSECWGRWTHRDSTRAEEENRVWDQVHVIVDRKPAWWKGDSR